MRKGNGFTDPWCALPKETIELAGIKVEVSGLSIKELSDLTKAHKDDSDAIAMDLICACCKRSDGTAITAEMVGHLRPEIYKALSEAVSRVNGFIQPGN